MNVLVYPPISSSDQSASSPATPTHPVLPALRQILTPFYTTQTITGSSLATHPWPTSCALLVLAPQSSGLSLSKNTTTAIQNYVQGGGKALVLGMELNASGLDGQDGLRFWDDSKKSYLYISSPTSNGSESSGLKRIRFAHTGECITDVPSAGVTFIDPLPPSCSPLASWDVQDQSSAAAIEFNVGSSQGRIALYDVLSTTSISPNLEGLLSQALSSIGLTLPSSNPTPPGSQPPVPTHPLPQILLSTPSKPWIIPRILSSLNAKTLPWSIIDIADTFVFETFDPAVLAEARISAPQPDTAPSEDAKSPTSQEKKVLVVQGERRNLRESMPMFDPETFYEALDGARKEQGLPEYKGDSEGWGMGEAMFYGEAVSSTQTMLDRNPGILNTLPIPFVSLATHQLAGRGRGSNTWLSPTGCLQFSLLLRVPTSRFPAARLVFIQYLFGLAVVKACRDDSVLGSEKGKSMKLKWPNDIYIDLGGDGKSGKAGEDGRKKVGGVLVNTSFGGGNVDIVIGCGVNVSTPAPISSLSLLTGSQESLRSEVVFALILSKFERMWETFVESKGSWAPFEEDYLDAWMHSDQLVTLTTQTPHRPVRIVGITPDHGLLRTMPERSISGASGGAHGGSEEGYIDLQPDGNSFDIMAGLIKAKK